MRTRWERRTRPSGRLEVAYAIQYWARLWVILLGLLPVLMAMLVGTLASTAVDGLFFPAPDYPAFTTLSAGLVLPALAMLTSAMISLPLPLEDRKGLRRVDMVWLALFSMAVTSVSLVLDDGRPQALHAAPYVAAVLFAVVAVMLMLRGLLSALRLLPESWRGTYRGSRSG